MNEWLKPYWFCSGRCLFSFWKLFRCFPVQSFSISAAEDTAATKQRHRVNHKILHHKNPKPKGRGKNQMIYSEEVRIREKQGLCQNWLFFPLGSALPFWPLDPSTCFRSKEFCPKYSYNFFCWNGLFQEEEKREGKNLVHTHPLTQSFSQPFRCFDVYEFSLREIQGACEGLMPK